MNRKKTTEIYEIKDDLAVFFMCHVFDIENITKKNTIWKTDEIEITLDRLTILEKKQKQHFFF